MCELHLWLWPALCWLAAVTLIGRWHCALPHPRDALAHCLAFHPACRPSFWFTHVEKMCFHSFVFLLCFSHNRYHLCTSYYKIFIAKCGGVIVYDSYHKWDLSRQERETCALLFRPVPLLCSRAMSGQHIRRFKPGISLMFLSGLRAETQDMSRLLPLWFATSIQILSSWFVSK